MNEGHLCCRNIAIIKVAEALYLKQVNILWRSSFGYGGVKTIRSFRLLYVALAERRIPYAWGEGCVVREKTGSTGWVSRVTMKTAHFLKRALASGEVHLTRDIEFYRITRFRKCFQFVNLKHFFKCEKPSKETGLQYTVDNTHYVTNNIFLCYLIWC